MSSMIFRCLTPLTSFFYFFSNLSSYQYVFEIKAGLRGIGLVYQQSSCLSRMPSVTGIARRPRKANTNISPTEAIRPIRNRVPIVMAAEKWMMCSVR